ncbi:hypothetical protein RN001_013305 [Aquatica leii]|uniref:Uncharacterized protein n=1 Tax=Aquatica leii TaxID=1421715 RepID=A0AAN7SNP1_9COLE|nr:hypothetical protein RN001_013305 [Aquatica leii]
MKNIIKFEAINDRISKLRIRGQISNTTLICVYAPTEVDTNEKKEDFYEKLIREYHIKTVAGKNTIHEKTNDNGNRICNLAAAMNLYLASTKFPHPTKHKITWNHPNQVTKSQIDHVLITKKLLKNIEDVRSYRGATADTDHVLVIATMKEKKSIAQDNRNTDKYKYTSKYNSRLKNTQTNSRGGEKSNRKFKNNKAAGSDNIIAEFIKNGGEKLHKKYKN